VVCRVLIFLGGFKSKNVFGCTREATDPFFIGKDDEEAMEPSHFDTTSWFLQSSAKSWGIEGENSAVQYKYYIPRCVHMPWYT